MCVTLFLLFLVFVVDAYSVLIPVIIGAELKPGVQRGLKNLGVRATAARATAAATVDSCSAGFGECTREP